MKTTTNKQTNNPIKTATASTNIQTTATKIILNKNCKKTYNSTEQQNKNSKNGRFQLLCISDSISSNFMQFCDSSGSKGSDFRNFGNSTVPAFPIPPNCEYS